MIIVRLGIRFFFFIQLARTFSKRVFFDLDLNLILILPELLLEASLQVQALKSLAELERTMRYVH